MRARRDDVESRTGESAAAVQGLVYILIAIAALGVGTGAYFGLTFSIIEAAVTALCFATLAVLVMERRLRIRAETRLERAIEDMARLLSNDARAGQVLSQRVNAMVDTNAGSRLDSIEADVSVLGTVVRQVAEAVADMQDNAKPQAAPTAEGGIEPVPVDLPAPVDEDLFPEPVIPTAQLEAAIERGRLVFHVDPIVMLPPRKPQGYDLVPRLLLDDGGIADAPDFMPRRGGDHIVRRIELMGLNEAVTIARRARTAGQMLRLALGLSRVSFTDRRTLDALLAVLVANQAIVDTLSFIIPHREWKLFAAPDKRLLLEIRKAGAGFVLSEATSLRFDYAELEAIGFTAVRFDTLTFLRQPVSLTDLHTADIAPYARRFSIELCATGVVDEQQLLSLFEDGIVLAKGSHVGRPGPVRPDLLADRPQATLGRRITANSP